MTRRNDENSRKAKAAGSEGGVRLYTLEVVIIGGPMTESFAERNRLVSRTIQIRGDQMLEELHDAIFDAFDREEEHMYEFQIGGRGPRDPKSRSYMPPEGIHDAPCDEPTGDVSQTVIGSLRLKVGGTFGYLFDFGDEWWHQIDVLDIKDQAPVGDFPKVVKRIGESPPQYPAWEEEDAE